MNLYVKGRVSVIIFVYNTAMHIAHTLQSMINQTYEDLEIIVVCDGTTDRSEEIAREVLEASQRRWAIYHTSGPSAYTPMTIDYPTWAGVARCTGEYINLHSADNISLPRKYEVLVGAIGSSPMVVGAARVFYDFDEDTVSDIHGVPHSINEALADYARSDGTRSRCRLSTESMLIRKDVYIRRACYAPLEIGGWDGESGLMLASYAEGDVVIVDEDLTHYREATPQYKARYALLLDRCPKIAEYMQDNGYDMEDIFSGKYKYVINRWKTHLRVIRDRVGE
jgi:glycosyltransferase involved in cell wall biosynthesis